MSCPYLENGICAVASVMAGFPVEISNGSCETCMRQENPQKPNHATASLALYRTRQRNEEEFFRLRKELDHLLNKVPLPSSNPHCKCEGPGFCPRHQIEKDLRQYRNCKGAVQTADCGRKYWVAWESGQLGATPPENPILNPQWECNGGIASSSFQKPSPGVLGKAKSSPPKKPTDSCKVGTRVKQIIKDRYHISSSPGCKCNKRAAEMDSYGLQWCKDNLDTAVDWLCEGAAGRMWLKPITLLFGGTIREKAKEIVLEAIRLEEEQVNLDKLEKFRKENMPNPLYRPWAYGVTTTASRLDNLLIRTLESLSKAGFDEPRLFIDGFEKVPYKGILDDLVANGKSLSEYPHTIRNPTIKVFGNWILGLWELYVRFPVCDFYAMFQDDFVTYPNLRGYLSKCPYPSSGKDRGYWNLLTFPKNQELSEGREGWYPSNQKGLGAVALVFNRDCVVDLLSSYKAIVERPMTPGKRSWSNIDGGIVTALKDKGWMEYVHNPSLVSHIGNNSTIRGNSGPTSHPTSTSFRGEDYDALQLTKGK